MEYGLDLKYLKQAHEINVGVAPDWTAARIAEAFEQRHRTLYGTSLGHRLMAVTARLTAMAPASALDPVRMTADSGAAPRIVRMAAIVGIDAPVPVFDRTSLRPGAALAGPAIVEEVDTSFYMPPGSDAAVDPYGNLIVRLKAA